MTTTTQPPGRSAPAKSEAKEADLAVGGMDCASCVAHVEKALRNVPGVESYRVNLARGRASVRFNPDRTSPQQLAAAVSQVGYPSSPESTGAGGVTAEEDRLQRQARSARAWMRRWVVGAILWLPVEVTHWLLWFTTPHAGHEHGHLWMHWFAFATSTVAIGYVGSAFYKSAFGALLRRTTNMDTLIAMGASVAYGYSLVSFVGYLAGAWRTLPDLYFMEATGLLALISLGHWLEARARQAAGSAIHELLNLAPAVALRVDEGGSTTEVPVTDLHVGDRVLVRPGDRVPTDGVVVEGRSSVDESMISGEPLPVPRGPGDEVIGGTLNHDGRLTVRVTRVGSESALGQIVRLVEQAQSSKPPVQRLADRIAAVFVPSVLAIALVTGAGWYAWGTAHDWDAARTWGMIAKAVCSVLIIACPCALGLAIPAALMVGTGLGARRGILIRDIDALQKAEAIDTVVLDKTGTVTAGRPMVTAVTATPESSNGHAREVLRFAAAAEQYSEHPVGKAIVAHAREAGLTLPDASSFTNHPGLGVIATVEGREVTVGNFDGAQPSPPDAGPGSISADASRIWVTVGPSGTDAGFTGTMAVTDKVKPDSKAAVAALHGLGLRTMLLTGDRRGPAEVIAADVGIKEVRAEVRPAEKAEVVRALQAGGAKVAMVGDGVNDAPALAAADLGIAVGSGSDVAKETGDIVLVGGSVRGVASAIRLSRATMRTIRQNLFLAFVYNVLAIPLAAFGLLNPLVAAAAMALSDVSVIGNALLLSRKRID